MMAGSEQKGTRRLRGDPAGASRLVARQAKVAPKRSATLDDNQGHSHSRIPTSSIGAPKKRAALTDLTNQGNGVSDAKAQQGVPTQVTIALKGKVRLTSQQIREREIELVPTGPDPQQRKCTPHIASSHRTTCEATTTSSTSSVQSMKIDGHSSHHHLHLPLKSKLPESVDTYACSEVIEIASDDSESIASLERKTQTNLYISRDSNARSSRQGCLLDGNHDEICIGCSTKNYTDIDGNHKDPQLCSSYAADIYQHLRMAERKRRPMDFMETVQQDINANMRGILVDWLVEVAEEYKLVPDTLYLTISYIDRYLSGNVVTRQKLQLLGVSCMLIASKYEEICAPQVEEFCYITDNTYSREEVLEMERKVLNFLRFELSGPTTKSFLRRFIRAAQSGQKSPNPNNLQLEFLGNYLAELTILEYGFVKYWPSMIAGSAVFMAKLTLNPSLRPWNSTLEHYTGYKASELKECIKAIHELQCNKHNCTLPAIREKYRQHKFKCVATLVPPAILPAEFFKDVDSS